MYRQIVLASAIFLLPFTSIAQESITKGWYLGLGLGVTQLDVSESEILADLNAASPIMANSADVDKSSSLSRVVLGRQLWPFISLEGGFTKLGEYDVEVDFGSNLIVEAETDIEALFFGFQAFTPRENRWGLYGKAGLARWELGRDLDDDGTDPYAGLGVTRKYLDRGRINFGVERFVLDDDALDSFSIEFIAQF